VVVVPVPSTIFLLIDIPESDRIRVGSREVEKAKTQKTKKTKTKTKAKQRYVKLLSCPFALHFMCVANRTVCDMHVAVVLKVQQPPERSQERGERSRGGCGISSRRLKSSRILSFYSVTFCTCQVNC
jgi:hypothetical protein